MEHFDYVVVGGGSAGCVLAARLSEEPAASVLVLEAGGDAGLLSDVPGLLLLITMNGWFAWPYETEPQRHLAGRRFASPRGRTLGGGSAINGMLYDRGDPSDYDSWSEFGVGGWSYAELLPYFRRLETWHPGKSPYHGTNGPVEIGRPGANHPLSKAWIEAGLQLGFPLNEDFSGASRDGVGPSDFTAARGWRSSTRRAYLRPARRRPNLTVSTESVVHRILVERGRATGVEYMKGGRALQVAAGEIVLSAGAINSPKLLMLSGIGDPAQLSRLDITATANLPGVGQNLQDHAAVAVSYGCTQPITLFNLLRPMEMVKAGLQYLSSRSGPLGVPAYEVIAYLRSGERVTAPDLKFTLALALLGGFGREINTDPGFAAYIEQVRPLSAGSLRLRSKDPTAAPLIDPNFFAEQADRDATRAGVRLARDLIAQSAFDPFRGEELTPGHHVQSDSELDEFLRTQATGDLHSVGTCRMGADRDAVVDERLRVHGIDGLWVADTSVIPRIISGNTNIPAIMIAEKASDMIRGLQPLAPIELRGAQPPQHGQDPQAI